MNWNEIFAERDFVLACIRSLFRSATVMPPSPQALRITAPATRLINIIVTEIRNELRASLCADYGLRSGIFSAAADKECTTCTSLHIMSDTGFKQVGGALGLNRMLLAGVLPEQFDRQPSSDPSIHSTALTLASVRGDKLVVEVLLAAGAKDPSGALMMTCHFLQRQFAEARCVQTPAIRCAQIAKLLINARANFDVQQENGWTALMSACQCGNPEIVDALVKASANRELRNDVGQNALMIACSLVPDREPSAGTWAGCTDIANVLIKSSADAWARGCTEAVMTLIQAGSNLDVQNCNGQTALMSACSLRCGHDPVSTTAWMAGRTDIAVALVKARAALDLQSNVGQTALMNACYWGLDQVVHTLIDAGANPDIKSCCLTNPPETPDARGSNLAGKSPLHDWLWEANLPTFDGWTALMMASWKGHTKVIQALTKAAIELDSRDRQGETALHKAFDKGHTQIVTHLIDKGAKLDIRIFESETVDA